MNTLEDIQAQVELERTKSLQLKAEIEKARQRIQQQSQEEEGEEDVIDDEQQAEMNSSSMSIVSSSQRRRRRRRRRRSSRGSSSANLLVVAGGNDNDNVDREMIALQTQVEGYRQLVDLLTKERPAIAAAMLREKQRQRQRSNSSSSSSSNINNTPILPVQLVRLLELIPWHPHVKERVDVQDTVYEWQYFDPLLKEWKGDLSSFPDFFHALPTTTSPHGDDDYYELQQQTADDWEVVFSDEEDDEVNSSSSSSSSDKGNNKINERSTNLLQRRGSSKGGAPLPMTFPTKNSFDFPTFLGGILPSRTPMMTDKLQQQSNRTTTTNNEKMVWTNANLTLRYIFTAKDGYPLPNPAVSGTWQWVGRWTVDRGGPQQFVINNVDSSSSSPNLVTTPFFDDGRDNDNNDDDDDNNNNKENKDSVVIARDDELCDEEGWTYARKASHFVLWNAKELCWGNAGAYCNCPVPSSDEVSSSDDNTDQSKTAATSEITSMCQQCHNRRRKPPVLRRRRWNRQRCLVEYPLASESSLKHLRLVAQNANIRLATQELSERLVEIRSTNDRVQNHWETTSTTNKVQLEHYISTWEKHEERIKQLRYGKFKRKIEELACNQDDILPIIANPDLFTQLQRALRQSGAITNTMLQQGIHFYILDYVRPVHGKSRRRKSSFDRTSAGMRNGHNNNQRSSSFHT